MKKKILTLIILLLISSNAIACDCKWGGNFIKSSKYSEVIIKAKILKKIYHFEDGTTLNSDQDFDDYLIKTNKEYYESIEVEVIELIKGKEERKIFEIYGSNGVDCREAIHIFEINKIYVLGIYKSKKTEFSQTNEDENDYAIGGCSEKWLVYIPKTREVKGYIKGKNMRRKILYSYDKLLKKIANR